MIANALRSGEQPARSLWPRVPRLFRFVVEQNVTAEGFPVLRRKFPDQQIKFPVTVHNSLFGEVVDQDGESLVFTCEKRSTSRF